MSMSVLKAKVNHHLHKKSHERHFQEDLSHEQRKFEVLTILT